MPRVIAIPLIEVFMRTILRGITSDRPHRPGAEEARFIDC